MKTPHPILYEVNARCWLRELAECRGGKVSLANVPEEEILGWKQLGITHLWLMGVWTMGAKARAWALNNADLRRSYDWALPGWRDEDVTGSPYAIAKYKVPPALGGETGLAKFRKKLHSHGLKLILDFVPNHVGLDHPWLKQQPDLFVRSPVEVPGTFPQTSATGVRWLAHGKDPYFAPWADTAQLDYRRFATRAAMKETLESIAERCDGVRCDMAMLVLNDVVAQTWQKFPFATDTSLPEFWSQTIPAIKEKHPDFLFMAEAYWDMEPRLLELGFDYAYEKPLYDEVVCHASGGPQNRLRSLPPKILGAGVHFLENHDEERAAAVFSAPGHRAAVLLMLGLPGMRFLHQGQLCGAKIKLPVQLGRRQLETIQGNLHEMYQTLLRTIQASAVGQGIGEVLFPSAAWPGNSTERNLLLVQWQAKGPGFDLVAVNLSPERSQGYVPLTVSGLADFNWTMKDRLGPETYERSGNDLVSRGLYLDMAPYGAQIFNFEALSGRLPA